MTDILKKIYTEIVGGTDTSLLIWTLIGFFIIILVSRKIGKIKELENREKLLFMIDIILFPIMLGLFYFISLAVNESNAYSISTSLILICCAWFFNRFLGIYFWDEKFAEKSGAKAPKLLQNFVAVIIYTLTVAFILGFIFNKPVTSIIVSTGVIATIIGFAMKDLLADIINGISISVERPYNIGDWIELENGSYLGKVVDIKWRTTRLMSRNNSMIVVPNNRCGNMIIHNFSAPEEVYSNNYIISINSTLPPDLVQRQLILGLQNVKNIVNDPAPRAYLADGTSEPFKYNVRVWWKSYEFSYFGRDDLFKKVTESLNKVGISQTSTEWQISKRGMIDEIEVKAVTNYDQVQKIDIFQNLNEDEINLLISNSKSRTFQPNEVIVNQNDEGDSLFIILAGNARVSLNKDGKDIKLGLLSPGDTFGEFSLLTGDRRSATVMAINHLESMEISKDALKSIIEKKPELIDDLSLIMAERQKANKTLNEKHKKLSAKEIIDHYKAEFSKKIKAFFN